MRSTRTIRRSLEVACPFTAAIDLAARCCARVAAGRMDARPLHDHTDGARRHTALAVEFVPLSRMPCPALRVLLTARPWHGGTRIHLEACYEPPFGRLGSLADALAGRHVASAAVERFARSLSAEIATAWSAERERWLPPPRRVADDDPSLVPA